MKTIKNTFNFENETLILDNNILTLKTKKISVRLSNLQKKFMWCLIRDITEKQDIIQTLWPTANWKSKGNNYNQLIFQTKAALQRSGFPKETLVAYPSNGICLNANLLRPIVTEQEDIMSTFNDQGLNYFGQ